jgi:release factor glutamine methyltransferase
MIHWYVKPRITKASTARMFGFTMHVPPTVFHPKFYFTSRFLGEYVSGMSLKGKIVLDVGCGSGLLSLVAASRGALVTSTDINRTAVETTLENATRNHLGHMIKGCESDVFTGLEKKAGQFDFILLNPPFYPEEPGNMTDRAWKSGLGHDFMVRFAGQVHDFLKPTGTVIMVLSSEAAVGDILRLFDPARFEIRPLTSRRVFFETLSIYALARKAGAPC